MSQRVQRGTYRRSCRTCGWTGTYTSVGRADYAKRRHSCGRHLQRVATRTRGEERRARWAALDRTPKPCLHKVANHRHGTYAAYTLDACRCPDCAQAVSDYERDRTRRNAYGRSNLVDADPVRAHIRGLGAQGMGWKRVATQAGVSNGAMWKLLYGRRRPDGTQKVSRRVLREVADRILAVELDLAPHAIIPADRAIGTSRKLQALVALGWSQSKLGGRLGIGAQNMTRLVRGGDGVQVRTARAVAALYDDLSMTLPPQSNQRERISVSRSIRMARERGWVPPLALDDERIDDPTHDPHRPNPGRDNEHVDEAAVLRRINGDRTVKLTRTERFDVVRRLNAQGMNDGQIEARTGIHRDQVSRDRNHLGLPAVGRWAS